LVPHRHLGSGYPRSNDILKNLLGLGCAVTYYPMRNAGEPWVEAYADVPRTVELVLGKERPPLPEFLEQRRGMFTHWFVSRPDNMRMIRELLQEQPDIASGVRLIYDAEALFVLRDQTRARILGEPVDPVAEQESVRAEVMLADKAQAVVTVNASEQGRFAEHLSAPVHVLGHMFEIAPTPRGFADRNGLLFVGAVQDSTSPNTDAILWFEREVFPKLCSDLQNITVAGVCHCDEVALLNRPQFSIEGPVEDLTPFYNRARVFIAPTRFAAGIPLKVQDAAGCGVPVVATPLLADQLGWKPEEEILVAGTPDEFAEQCRRLHEDAALWERIRANALNAVQRDCAPAAFKQRLREILALSGN
jgi:hypothetical protein